MVTTSKETYLDGPTVDSILCVSNTPKVQVVVFEVEKQAKKKFKEPKFCSLDIQKNLRKSLNQSERHLTGKIFGKNFSFFVSFVLLVWV